MHACVNEFLEAESAAPSFWEKTICVPMITMLGMISFGKVALSRK